MTRTGVAPRLPVVECSPWLEVRRSIDGRCYGRPRYAEPIWIILERGLPAGTRERGRIEA